VDVSFNFQSNIIWQVWIAAQNPPDTLDGVFFALLFEAFADKIVDSFSANSSFKLPTTCKSR
jgi:hypothetical protein